MPVRDAKYMKDQRQRIMEAAFRCFSKHGLQKTSIRAICKEADMAVGTLYIHFKNRNEILSAMTLMAYEEPLERMEFQDWDAFHGHLLSAIDIKNNPANLQYFICDLNLAAEAQDNEELAALLRKSVGEILDWTKKCLSRFVEQGEIELPLGLDATARSIRYLVNGIVTNQLLADPSEEKDHIDAFNKTLGVLVKPIVRAIPKDSVAPVAASSD